MAKQTDKFLPFTNDFIFSLVMQDPLICRELLERILPDEEFSEIKLEVTSSPFSHDDLPSADTQKTLKFSPDSHGVRFDAYIKGQDIWAEVEMQTYTQAFIGKRSRYYHSNMDMDFLVSGKSYSQLKKSYVIFICTFDYMRKGAPIYHFRNYDIATGVHLNDDSHTIILNTSCPPEKVPDKLKPLYNYINGNRNSEDEFIKALDSSVIKYNSPEWRKRLMTLDELIDRAEDRMARLSLFLVEANRTEDLVKAVSDPTYRDQLFKEFGLK